MSQEIELVTLTWLEKDLLCQLCLQFILTRALAVDSYCKLFNIDEFFQVYDTDVLSIEATLYRKLFLCRILLILYPKYYINTQPKSIVNLTKLTNMLGSVNNSPVYIISMVKSYVSGLSVRFAPIYS